MRQDKELDSDQLKLTVQERSAIFISGRNVPVFPVKFHHLFLVVMMRNPGELDVTYRERAQLFYEYPGDGDQKPKFFSEHKAEEKTIWASTISATSECAYAPKTSKDLGKLLSIPNYDRNIQSVTGEVVFTKKIVSNNVGLMQRALDFEIGYKNDQKYAMIPETSSGYNSNSFFRGVIEYMGIADDVIVPSCLKALGLSKALMI
jgi:hypothetical protein